VVYHCQKIGCTVGIKYISLPIFVILKYLREPHKIIQFPLDVSSMSEMERTRLLSKRYGKQINTKFHERISLDEEDDEQLQDFDDFTS
jgi:hypothetical protein